MSVCAKIVRQQGQPLIQALGITETGVMMRSFAFLSAALLLLACAPRGKPMNPDITDFATRYAAAWSSQNPTKFASFYTENGSLMVNDGPSSNGRVAIAATARSFMSAFPDMIVKLDRMDRDGDHPVFHWIWTGTNTGAGGTGKFVRMTGYEVWTMGANGLIAKSEGHYDEAEYQRQLKFGAPSEP